ncbi:conserved hypothetical protein [uncultured Pleomorphomonas sp.]|uniref:Uncharacterized protein n=1 Tax=uncultured Pleomorphomonas sp. TaxID=442121 RepID=A0A212LNJ7_9HYPH|nr:conserved hypothetical protein [uncultured Pleomorphomonas sp.]
MRHRRPAQRRQVHALQRAHQDRGRPGGQLSLLHHRAEHRRGGGARSAPVGAGRKGQVGADRADPHHLRRHRRPGARRLQGRGPRQPVPRQHPRGRRHRPRAPLLRGQRHHPRRGPHRSGERRRDGGNRADAVRPREPGAARRAAPQARPGRRQGHQGAGRIDGPRPRGAAQRPAGPRRRHPQGRGSRLRGAQPLDRQAGALRLQRRGSGGRHRQQPVGARLRDGRETGRQGGDHLGGHRGGGRPARRRRAEGIPRNARLGRTRPRPADPRRLRPARPDHLFHRRPQGGPRLDDRQGYQGAAGGRRHPHRFRARLHPRPDHRLRGLHRLWRGEGQGARQGARRRQGVCRPGRRRHAVQVQHLTVRRRPILATFLTPPWNFRGGVGVSIQSSDLRSRPKHRVYQPFTAMNAR